MNYLVVAQIAASMALDIEADSPEEALEKGYDEVGMPSICHQCSDKIEIGEPYGWSVIEDSGDGEEVYIDNTEEEFRRKFERLLAAAREAVETSSLLSLKEVLGELKKE